MSHSQGQPLTLRVTLSLSGRPSHSQGDCLTLRVNLSLSGDPLTLSRLFSTLFRFQIHFTFTCILFGLFFMLFRLQLDHRQEYHVRYANTFWLFGFLLFSAFYFAELWSVCPSEAGGSSAAWTAHRFNSRAITVKLANTSERMFRLKMFQYIYWVLWNTYRCAQKL